MRTRLLDHIQQMLFFARTQYRVAGQPPQQ